MPLVEIFPLVASPSKKASFQMQLGGKSEPLNASKWVAEKLLVVKSRSNNLTIAMRQNLPISKQSQQSADAVLFPIVRTKSRIPMAILPCFRLELLI